MFKKLKNVGKKEVTLTEPNKSSLEPSNEKDPRDKLKKDKGSSSSKSGGRSVDGSERSSRDKDRDKKKDRDGKGEFRFVFIGCLCLWLLVCFFLVCMDSMVCSPNFNTSCAFHYPLPSIC